MTQCLQILKTGFCNSTIPSSEQHSVHPEQVRSLTLLLPFIVRLTCGPCFILPPCFAPHGANLVPAVQPELPALFQLSDTTCRQADPARWNVCYRASPN